jgi:UPF0755 protein
VLRIGVTRAELLARELDPATGRFVEVALLPVDAEERPEEFDDVCCEPDTRFRVTLAEGVTSWQVWFALNNAPDS